MDKLAIDLPEGSELYNSILAMRKERERCKTLPVDGERFTIPRKDALGVEVIIHTPENTLGKLPLILNMHGGAWVGGDAVYMESFCKLISDSIPAVVVNVNYHKADVVTIPEIVDELCDCVKFFIENSEKFNVAANKIAIGGHSAGAHLAACAALKLKDEGIALACQTLVYPCTAFVSDGGMTDMLIKGFFPNGGNEHKYVSPLLAKDEELKNLCQAVIVVCGLDGPKPFGVNYAKRLSDNGVQVDVKEYEKALHGFLEVCRNDYPSGDERSTAEQAEYARDCEQYLIGKLKTIFK